ncbi:leucyl aminopeptidase family protein [Aliiglaciecola sp. CAU 1673]|uniref:leucyl aminopeptidase family protein n=1 Tax=Aliiglaciecola sp. CAU 1673 TaxID=3032595 RepID=UPI0023DB69CC|nr:leucyl aminopeptidase family protein [Aliiglaciecola sp. CAU 1673]MDF2178582.1 leucyl aminopeptidase family protein [Aliiglaciecola sp. CAU 1673]
MKNLRLWQACAAILLLVGSGLANATSIEFSTSVRSDTFARVLFQFSDSTGNLSGNIDDNIKTQLKNATAVYDFKGEHNSQLKLVTPADGDTLQVLVMGLGDPEKLDRADAVALGGNIAQMFTHKDVQKIDVVVKGIQARLDQNVLAAHIAQGISLGSYRFNRYRQEVSAPNNDYRIIIESDKEAKRHYEKLRAIENGVFLARDMVNTNAAEMNPVAFIDEAQKALKGLDVEIDVFSAEQIKAMNMGLLYAVGQGSAPGARLMVAHYKGSNDKPIALVGKGITFDTGGYNIKTHESIARMKGDMAGAAAVLGAVRTLAEQKAKVNVIAVMPLAANMVSETALLPGDIITSMSGKSVEIINTDAEGRLIMADAMWHVQEQYHPQILVNIATLTGSKIRAVGDRYAGLFSDDEQLIAQLSAAGEAVNEPLWRLPLAYGDMLQSTLADTTNTGSDGPGASTAAMFLKQFVQEQTRWAHLDIAGNESVTKTKNEIPAGGVGYGVRLLVEWLSTLQ